MNDPLQNEGVFQGHSLLNHALELRRRVMIAFVSLLGGFAFCYFFAPDIFSFLVRPLALAMEGDDRRLIYTGLAEAFITYLRLSFWGGIVLAFPIIIAQVWLFIAPALYRHERRAMVPFLMASPLLFLMGAALAYYFVFPTAWHFFLSFEMLPAGEAGLPIQLEARVSEYLSLSMTLIFAFGLAFQLPVLLVLLVRTGVLTAQKLTSMRRFAVVLIFTAAALLTPPDVFSQFALALPMLILYEISIFGAKWVEKQRGR